MKNILDKIKGLLGKLRGANSSYTKPHIWPHRDWFYILLSTNVVIVLLIIYSVYLYIEIVSDKFVAFDPAKSSSEIKLNSDLLNKIVLDLNNRAQNIKSLSTHTIPQDPSR